MRAQRLSSWGSNLARAEKSFPPAPHLRRPDAKHFVRPLDPSDSGLGGPRSWGGWLQKSWGGNVRRSARSPPAARSRKHAITAQIWPKRFCPCLRTPRERISPSAGKEGNIKLAEARKRRTEARGEQDPTSTAPQGPREARENLCLGRSGTTAKRA